MRLADDDLRALRSGAQLLHRPGRFSIVELVAHLTGVQAQVLSAAGFGLRSRAPDVTADQVDAARLRERAVVLTWAMRGTLHLIAARDYGWLVPLVMEPQVPNAYRRLMQEGVPEEQRATALELIHGMLDREGPLTRREIAERLRAAGIRVEGQAIAHLVWLAAARGIICYGPDRGREQALVLVQDWIGETKGMDRDGALSALALRYVAAHQPAQPRDLAAWSGLAQRDANRAWRQIEDRLRAVETTRGTLWTLQQASEPAPAGLVRLLPGFDEYLLGWQGRDLTVRPEHRTSINRGGGWVRPVLLIDGQAAGTWNLERAAGALRMRLEPFGKLEAVVRQRVLLEVDDLSRFLGVRIEAAFE